LLKLGSYKLNRAKETGDDWVFLIDKTIQMGPDKCLAIAGVRLSKLRQNNLTLSHNDLEPLVVNISQSCPGEKVYEALKEAQSKTGKAPCQILSDGGTDLLRGIRMFVEENNTTHHSYDITHKLALLMKDEFGQNNLWDEFRKSSIDLTQKIKLSPIAHLAPPRLRPKSSILNLRHFIRWGFKLLQFVKTRSGLPMEDKFVSDTCGWIIPYEEFLAEALQIVEIADATKVLVHKRGYRVATMDDFKKITSLKTLYPRAKRFAEGVEDFLKSQCSHIPLDEFRLGSTDVLESVFGKFKGIEGQYANEGFTALVGVLPVLMAPTTEQEIIAALSETTVKKIREKWGENGSGGNYLAKRRADLTNKNIKDHDFKFYLFQEEISELKMA